MRLSKNDQIRDTLPEFRDITCIAMRILAFANSEASCERVIKKQRLAIGTFNQNRDNDGKINQEVVKDIRRQINEAATNAKDVLIRDVFSGNSTAPQFAPSSQQDQSHLNQDYPALPEDDNDFLD
ncbi:hypothetical protein M9Y10_000724 [Tritrichomonas musculus]|uniref:Uncharacterized protein n=1 Tax=Tritrichomonas musculus TaxID=1915356 RepID=A0ABR2L5E4_9EUKA